MSLFKVEGWDVPSQVIPAISPSKKRKRGKQPDVSGYVESTKITPKIEKSNSRKNTKLNGQKKSRRGSPKINARGDAVVNNQSTKSNNASKDKILRTEEHKNESMTDLQARMKNKLEGARFRWINEMLYTADSSKSLELMQNDPNLFQEYHSGFRSQVLSWPQNPVQHFISVLSSSPEGTVVVDLGCGEAALAKSLIPKGICVLSYDLVRCPPYVIEADICQWIPLPGSEHSDEGHVVDVCVCALSLMGTNWVGCIRECWRILKMSGKLKIAEVTSRFTNVKAFIDLVANIGFKLKSEDQSNTHFTLFEFQKISRSHLQENQWLQLAAKHDVLKPCEYKRR
ncbi:hypothetical protein Clacol_001717 [Clathrus columnatus]|uniref:Ribosomal RNA-processing protein 8 n=1 Tax=Clathrus columnatus TaxID=1419009 RepID=A0AAV4ZZX6_9AGAM|nr:hypothetical protein Clacol_001717 [Clathrus columnatus]